MKIKQLSFSWKIFVAFQHLLTRFIRPLFKFMIPNQPPPQALRFSHGRGERETSDW